jgi:hypothetical protein
MIYYALVALSTKESACYSRLMRQTHTHTERESERVVLVALKWTTRGENVVFCDASDE